MARRSVVTLVVIAAMLALGVFARWRVSLVSRASGSFGDKRMEFKLRESHNGIYLHKHGAGGTAVRFFAEIEPGPSVRSHIEVDETLNTVTVAYGDVVQKFAVDTIGNLIPTE